MAKVIRSVKNVTKGYSNVQVKVRNATSNDPWGPTGSDMSQIAQMTFNSSNDFYEIMEMLDKRLNDKGKNWRHVLKALKVLDYCLHEGSEIVVTWAHKNIYIIKTLREFQYVDEEGRDVGQNVRVSAKELTSLILDDERLRSERSDRRNWKSRVTGIEEFGPPQEESTRRIRPQRAERADEEDAEYKLAIEASKFQGEEDRRRRQSQRASPDDEDLAKAIKLSKEEEEQRQRELEEQNASSLFDEDPIQVPQATGFNQGYQQQTQVDWAGNPIDPNVPQQTGYLTNMYTGFSRPTTDLQQDPSIYQNGYQNLSPSQPTGIDPFGQQQFQPQSTSYNLYTQHNASLFVPQQTQQQQRQLEPMIPSGTNNPWATNNKNTYLTTLKRTQTGSNNPFASSFGRSLSTTSPSKPTLSALHEQQIKSFGNKSSLSPTQSFSSTMPLPPPSEVNPYHSKLNALLSSGEGQDTFGNTGEMRIPAQHTAPGTFVNSSGAGLARLTASKTGNNPFLQFQYTGIPQTKYEDNLSSRFGGRQPQVQTLPGTAGMSTGYGSQSTNLYGSRAQHENGGHGDLIQF